jgi:hypothetical protein
MTALWSWVRAHALEVYLAAAVVAVVLLTQGALALLTGPGVQQQSTVVHRPSPVIHAHLLPVVVPLPVQIRLLPVIVPLRGQR